MGQTDATKNGGAGVLIEFPDRQPIQLSAPTGKICTNFKAEVKAIESAVTSLLEPNTPKHSTVFLTDSLSTLQSLTNPKADATLLKLLDKLQLLSKQQMVTLQWIPAHCGVPGNEEADKLSKLGSNSEQPETDVSLQEVKTILKHHQKTSWRNQNQGYNPKSDQINMLDRSSATIIYRLRTGHCCLKGHLRKINVLGSALCPCGTSDETPNHVLQDCILYKVERENMWPQRTETNVKLWGGQDDLERTIQFIRSTGLKV